MILCIRVEGRVVLHVAQIWTIAAIWRFRAAGGGDAVKRGHRSVPTRLKRPQCFQLDTDGSFYAQIILLFE